MQVLRVSEFSPPKSFHSSSPESSAKLRCYFWLAISKRISPKNTAVTKQQGLGKRGKKRKGKKYIKKNTCYSPLAYDSLLEHEQDFTSHAVL